MSCVERVYTAPEDRMSAPSFDHALKDPCPDGFVIEPCHEIILVEGLYVLLGTNSPGLMYDSMHDCGKACSDSAPWGRPCEGFSVVRVSASWAPASWVPASWAYSA